MEIKGQGSIRIPLIDKLTANNIGVNVGNQGLFFYRAALFIVKLKIQVKNGTREQSVQANDTILQSSCRYIGDLHYAFALVILVECFISTGQADSLAVMSAVIEQDPENRFTTATNFQDMFFIFEGGN